MASVFTKVIRGELPCYKIAENENCFALLDINPLVVGHVLVVPKIETDYIFDLEDSIYSELMLFSKKVARAIRSSVPCKRVGVAVIGLEVPHAHIHLIPLQAVSDINFERPKLKLDEATLQQVHKNIVDAFQRLQ
jgi:histidine triad (HIT) family protein